MCVYQKKSQANPERQYFFFLEAIKYGDNDQLDKTTDMSII